MKFPYTGLSLEEVRERKRAGLVNVSVAAPSKTVNEIVRSNILTYFNFIFLIIAILLILVGSFRDLTFLPVVIANALIGIIQELRAKQVLDKLTVLHAPKARVIRAGEQEVIPVEKLVLDDVVIFKTGDQIPADAVVLSGEVAVNEALLTGEADEIIKTNNDDLMSGSFVVYGECYAKLTKVGEESYASQLTLKAKAIRVGEQSKIIKSLNDYVRIIGIAMVPIAIILFSQQFFFANASARMSVQSMVAAVIGMIPEGLFLFSSVTLMLSAVRLALSKVMLHDMKSIETLARVDTLCVDKTGTITSGDMKVVNLIPLIKNDSELLPSLIGEVVSNLSADNATMKALKLTYKRGPKQFRLDDYEHVSEIIPFSSKYKYSGVHYEKAAYVIGAPEFVLREDYELVQSEVNKWSKKGYRVLVFGKYGGSLAKDSKLTAKVKPMGLIVLANEIRKTAPATFAYFREQGVDIKVISGDNPVTVSEVAKQVVIPNSDKYVDATKLGSGKNFEKAVMENTVFGRVTPELKRRIINILKDNGRTVAMTGDGVNDVLALKDADCSVAMASGAQAAVQASQVVLLESDFSKMPSVVREGRQVVNNLERSGSLFIMKNIFSLIMAIISICFAVKYPLIPTQVSLVTMFTIGVPSFLLAQIPNEQLIRGSFLKNIISTAFPAALTNVVLISLAVIICDIFKIESSVASTICTMTWAVVGLMHLFRICWPFDKWKRAIFSLCAFGMLFCMIFLPGLFGLDHTLGASGWIIFAIIAALTYPTMLIMIKLSNHIDKTFTEKYMEKFSKRMERINMALDKI